MNFNRIIIAGNICRDPQLKHLPSGTTVTEFAVAVNRKYRTGDGESKEEVCFLDCTAWGKVGEIINQHLRKGSPIFVEGRVKQDVWEDKQSGGKRSKLSVVVESFQFIGGRDGESKPARRQQQDGPSVPPDDFPPF